MKNLCNIEQLFLAILFLILPGIACSSKLAHREMQSENTLREYFPHIPSGYRNDLAVTVVMVFHGGGGNAEHIAKFAEFNSLSENYDFLAIYPQAIEKHWNDGRESEKFRDHDAMINDVAWIEKLILEIKKTYAVDHHRIYATGVSNGGIFSQRLAIELGQHFAVVASLTAQIAEP